MKYYNIEIPNNQIIESLENNLIHPKKGLMHTYDNLISYFLKANSETPIDTKTSLMETITNNTLEKDELINRIKEIENTSRRTMAIDFPVVLKSLNENVVDTILVASMDPLTANITQDEIAKSKIGTWVPFSLVDSDTTGEKAFKSNRAFFIELLKKYHVYVTDIYKLFYRAGNHPSDVRSNSLNEYTSLICHQIILKKEIEVINPKAIVTLGNSSRNAVYAMKGLVPKAAWGDVQVNYWDKTPIISIPHMSGAANKTSSAILKKYPELTGCKTEKLAKLVKIKLEAKE
jgi:hypothetical protein